MADTSSSLARALSELPPDCLAPTLRLIGAQDVCRLLQTGNNAMRNILLKSNAVKSLHYTPSIQSKAKWPSIVDALPSLAHLTISFDDPFKHINVELPDDYKLPHTLETVHFEFGNANIFSTYDWTTMPMLRSVYLNGDTFPLRTRIDEHLRAFTLVGYSTKPNSLEPTFALEVLHMQLHLNASEVHLLPRTLTDLQFVSLAGTMSPEESQEQPEESSTSSESEESLSALEFHCEQSPRLLEWPPALTRLALSPISLDTSTILPALPRTLTDLTLKVTTIETGVIFPPALTKLVLYESQGPEDFNNLVKMLPKDLLKLYFSRNAFPRQERTLPLSELPPKLQALEVHGIYLHADVIESLPHTLTLLQCKTSQPLAAVPLHLNLLRKLFVQAMAFDRPIPPLTTLHCQLLTTDIHLLPETLTKLHIDVQQMDPSELWTPRLPKGVTALHVFGQHPSFTLDPKTKPEDWPERLQSLCLVRVKISHFSALPRSPHLRKLKIHFSNSNWHPDSVGIECLSQSIHKLILPDLSLDDEDVFFLPRYLTYLSANLRLSSQGYRSLPRTLRTLKNKRGTPPPELVASLPEWCTCST